MTGTTTILRQGSCARAIWDRWFGVLSFTVLLSLASIIKVPLFFTPVPVTLQVFVVALAAGLLSPGRSFAAVFSYVVLGAAGVPVFANSGAGLFYLAGPTGGYLLGFLVATWVISTLRQAFPSEKWGVVALHVLAGVATIYLMGGYWLAAGWGWEASRIWSWGILPFIGADVAKVLCAVPIIKSFPKKWRSVL